MRTELTPSRRQALGLLGLSADEWWFVQGRYEQARNELSILRLSLKRVAQATNNPGVLALIPPDNAERGWSRLCAALIVHLEESPPDPNDDPAQFTYPEDQSGAA